jgi:hypothetical protein
MPKRQIASREPAPELGPAMRALPPKWQQAVMHLFLNGGNKTGAVRSAGFGNGSKQRTLSVIGHRLFNDERVRAAVKEVATANIDIAEPEVLATTLDIMRDGLIPARDRLRAAGMIWDRANPVINKTKVDITSHLSTDELDLTHYRALQRIGAPHEAFINRFGESGLARVEAMALADDNRMKLIESGQTVDADYEDVTNE